MTGPASLRREWFLGKFSNESTVVPGSTPCSDSLSQSLLSSPTTVQVGIIPTDFWCQHTSLIQCPTSQGRPSTIPLVWTSSNSTPLYLWMVSPSSSAGSPKVQHILYCPNNQQGDGDGIQPMCNFRLGSQFFTSCSLTSSCLPS